MRSGRLFASAFTLFSASVGEAAVSPWGFGMNTTAVAGRALQVGIIGNAGNGACLTGGGTWTNASDKNLKEDFQEVNGNALLKKVPSYP